MLAEFLSIERCPATSKPSMSRTKENTARTQRHLDLRSSSRARPRRAASPSYGLSVDRGPVNQTVETVAARVGLSCAARQGKILLYRDRSNELLVFGSAAMPARTSMSDLSAAPSHVTCAHG